MVDLDNVVSRIQTYVSLRNPTGRNVRSFMDWIRDHKPLTKEESRFLEHQDDFVALSDGQENGWLDGLVEDTLNWCLPDNLMRVSTSYLLLHSYSKPKLLSPLTYTTEMFHFVRAIQPHRRRPPPPLQQTPHRPGRASSSRHNHRCLVGRAISSAVLGRGPEFAENLSDSGIHAAFRGGIECLYEGQEA